MKINKNLTLAFFIFPFNVMGTIPACLVWVNPKELSFQVATMAGGGFLVAIGVPVIYHTVSLFTELGQGTPAPFDPPKKFVSAGAYRFVRNPMIIGVILVLFGESLIFRCLPLLDWSLFFMLANFIYVPFFEEKELEARFGISYRIYKKRVPRWIPRNYQSSSKKQKGHNEKRKVFVV